MPGIGIGIGIGTGTGSSGIISHVHTDESADMYNTSPPLLGIPKNVDDNDEIAQWDFSYYILSLDINDTKGWHDIALLALKDTVVGSGWRFLKAHSMTICHHNRSLEDSSNASARSTYKFHVRSCVIALHSIEYYFIIFLFYCIMLSCISQ